MASFLTRGDADIDTVHAAVEAAGYAPTRSRARMRSALEAVAGLGDGRTVQLAAGWHAGRNSDVPTFTVTLHADLGGGAFWCKQTLARSPLPVPGDHLAADGAPRAAVASALEGRLGVALATLADEASYLNRLEAEDDVVTLSLTGWPPTAREVHAAVSVCVQVADLLAASAPAAAAETAAFRAARADGLRRSRRIGLALIGGITVPAIAATLLLLPA